MRRIALKIKAEKGDANAQCALGMLYLEGLGGDRDEVEGFKWLLRAAENGVSEAQFQVAIAYLKGEGVHQDAAEAVRWFVLAAMAGIRDAAYNLGHLYASGCGGIERNPHQARKWFFKAVEYGDVDAQRRIRELSRELRAV